MSPGAAYLARRTLALLRDAIDLDTGRLAWQDRLLPLICQPPDSVEIEFDKMELRESARDILLQRSTASRRAAPEWEAAQSCFVGQQSYEAVVTWLDDATAWQMESRQIHGTCQLSSVDMFGDTDPNERFRIGGTVTVHSLKQATQHNGHHGTLVGYVDDVSRWMVKLSSGETIRVQSANLRALLNEYHPLLLTPAALDDPANIWCLPSGRAQTFTRSATATVARHGALGPPTATSPWTVCAAPSPPPLSSSARPSSAYCATNGPRTGGRTPWRLPTSPRGAATWRKIAPTPSTTQDSVSGTSTKRKYFWLGGLLALVLWCLEYSAFQTLAFRTAVSK